ncbi:MAG: WYL domain-containing protein [Vulcanimicrobiaceae bacterium]|jgi:predicted DNA-binding transcriptional regulator YafY
MATTGAAFATGRRRKDSAPSEAAARKIWVLLMLLQNGRVRFDDYERAHNESFRSFQRDLQHLRALGESFGFTISTIVDKQTAKMSGLDKRLGKLDASRELVGLVANLAQALGEPVALEVGPATGNAAGEHDPFEHFSMPHLVEGSRVARIFQELKKAWSAKPLRALVQFEYEDGRGSKTERRVDPHRMVVRAGRYYLVGYDENRRGWRAFALDRFTTIPKRAGTCNVLRTIPPEYASNDVVGFIKGSGPVQAVTVEFTRDIAATAVSRQWQAGQLVEKLPGGRARVTLNVSDPKEVIRWAFGFGPDARVVAPPGAVVEAHRMAQELGSLHEDARPELRVVNGRIGAS